jgi:hypothetical protein
MRHFILSLSVLALTPILTPTASIAEVRHIQQMSQTSNGNFQVTCLNQQIEIVTNEQILRNNVCNYDGNIRIDRDNDRTRSRRSGDSRRASLICSGDSTFDNYYITRVYDNKRIGGKMPLDNCRRAIYNTRGGVVCSGDSFADRFYLTRINDATQLSSGMSLNQCLNQIDDVVR